MKSVYTFIISTLAIVMIFSLTSVVPLTSLREPFNLSRSLAIAIGELHWSAALRAGTSMAVSEPRYGFSAYVSCNTSSTSPYLEEIFLIASAFAAAGEHSNQQPGGQGTYPILKLNKGWCVKGGELQADTCVRASSGVEICFFGPVNEELKLRCENVMRALGLVAMTCGKTDEGRAQGSVEFAVKGREGSLRISNALYH